MEIVQYKQTYSSWSYHKKLLDIISLSWDGCYTLWKSDITLGGLSYKLIVIKKFSLAILHTVLAMCIQWRLIHNDVQLCMNRNRILWRFYFLKGYKNVLQQIPLFLFCVLILLVSYITQYLEKVLWTHSLFSCVWLSDFIYGWASRAACFPDNSWRKFSYYLSLPEIFQRRKI